MSRPTSVFPSTGSSSSLRQSSIYSATSQQSSVLAARIASKRLELENLRQLRDVSGALAAQIEALEEKLSTLKGGTEAVACVMANWGNVLSAISMASTKAAAASERDSPVQGREADNDDQKALRLPSTLVRIPAEQPSMSRRRGGESSEG
ncbi:uncharacterized protein PADG_02373 [Paracoccidioides brasiliensis Pb18]|uniref:DASH complex subunit DAD2 n=2 Tax=Paracoccidioides brasiliensis TaxID=121759 RepID=C1G2K7_PARBD|nr:uncharacterized protein PADG_02373 [Paracoccidioides brasiliensis Pb18]EEH46223.2 hypothetical protein PADG_02373 [Paracoccidioides brasiliensis Pb18]ODH26199.1 hypothetical protein ACO22_04747 [Paracoccidioides brasiliensis]ODH49657.1 hypothetical protein GX48_04181 [Paracoccidioides brasiliensis]